MADSKGGSIMTRLTNQDLHDIKVEVLKSPSYWSFWKKQVASPDADQILAMVEELQEHRKSSISEAHGVYLVAENARLQKRIDVWQQDWQQALDSLGYTSGVPSLVFGEAMETNPAQYGLTRIHRTLTIRTPEPDSTADQLVKYIAELETRIKDMANRPTRERVRQMGAKCRMFWRRIRGLEKSMEFAKDKLKRQERALATFSDGDFNLFQKLVRKLSKVRVSSDKETESLAKKCRKYLEKKKK